jgi:hypothetical protein
MMGGMSEHDHLGGATADDCGYQLVDRPCGCQDIRWDCGYTDREHDHAECGAVLSPLEDLAARCGYELDAWQSRWLAMWADP